MAKKNEKKIQRIFSEKKAVGRIKSETKHSIFAIGAFVLGLIFILSYFEKAGMAGVLINKIFGLSFRQRFFPVSFGFVFSFLFSFVLFHQAEHRQPHYHRNLDFSPKQSRSTLGYLGVIMPEATSAILFPSPSLKLLIFPSV